MAKRRPKRIIAYPGANQLAYEINSPNAAFSWKSFKVIQQGSSYYTDLNFDSLKPTPDFIYYCSPTGSAVASPSNNDPTNPITPRRAVTLANAHGGNIEMRCAAGYYYGNIGFDGNNFTCTGVIVSLWDGQQSAHPKRPIFVKRTTNLAAPWSADEGNTYFTAHSVASTTVMDVRYTSDGLIPRLTEVGSLALCRATPGSYFFDVGASRMYVTAQDRRNLIGDADMQAPTGGTHFNHTATVNCVTWMDGIVFVGGNVISTMATLGMTHNYYARNCGYFGGANGIALIGPGTCIHVNPRVGGNRGDGMNYHGNAQGDINAVEIDLQSYRNGFDAAGTNNASTLHENCTAICINGNYAGSENRVINDINSSKRWMVNSAVRASVASDATSVTVQAGISGGTAAQIWLDACDVAQSTTAALYADTGCSIHLAGMSTAGKTLAGAGTIDTYLRSTTLI